ncbi:MAG: hypothetical protein AAGD08_15970 [Pseudomonadota bacterium]
MTHLEKPIEEATREELYHYAKVILNLPLQGNPGRERLMIEIRAVEPDVTMIKVKASEAEAKATDKQRFPRLPQEFSGKRTWFILHADSNRPGGEDPHPVSINGHCIYIPRGVRVALPDEYLACVEDAVENAHDWSEKHGLTNQRPRQRLSYTIHGPLKPEEYQAA